MRVRYSPRLQAEGYNWVLDLCIPDTAHIGIIWLFCSPYSVVLTVARKELGLGI